jgi:hypothetical protein
MRARPRGAVLTVGVLALVAATSRPAVAAQQPEPASMRTVVVAFVHEAVQRRHPERAWTLVTSSIRIRTTRADWNAGTMRVVPVLSPELLQVTLRVVDRKPGTVLILLGLHRRGDRLADSEGRFLIRLVRRHGRWLVDYWGPAMLIAPQWEAGSAQGPPS